MGKGFIMLWYVWMCGSDNIQNFKAPQMTFVVWGALKGLFEFGLLQIAFELGAKIACCV